VPRKGYRILSRPDCITAEEVESRIETKWAGRTIHFLETVDSTNTEASRLAENGAPEGMLVLAEEQGSGKGRRGRTWVTPAGSAIAMSLIVRPQIPPSRASMLTLVMGLAVAYGCRDCFGVETSIKWPNDIVVDGRKICGILTEMSSEIDYIKYLVIGTGINTCIEQFPEELTKTAASLHAVIGSRPDRAALIAACMKRFEEFYETFLETQDLSGLQEAYNALLAGRGGMVRVLEPGHEYSGISEGINEYGELLVRREDGTLERVYAGEVSVRGIYGYV
jgi:BirA family biotin operon repressor/biotin-[acetyl-CoA-carboxylase] ligase